MRNSKRRHKPSPLQVWKAQYKWISEEIRAMKDALKRGTRIGELTFARQQAALVYLRECATMHMERREDAQKRAQELWENDQPQIEIIDLQATEIRVAS